MNAPFVFSAWPVATRLFVFAILLNLSTSARAEELPAAVKPGTFTLIVQSGGFDRTTHIHIPKDYKVDSKPPLLLAFHGAGGNGQMMLERNGWRAKSDKEGFIVVSPTGLPALPRLASDFKSNPNLWNSGQLNARSPRARIDDVQFTAVLLDELKKRISFDEKRVYVAGHSNGASMAFKLGAELSDRFAAIAPVAGLMAVKDPKPKRPVPALYIVGTKDPAQPLAGGEVTLPWATRTNPPVAENLSLWAKGMGCAAEPKTISDKEGLKRVEYPATKAGGPTLQVIYIEGHGHEWPGGRSGLPARLLGPDASKMNAVDVIWDFFKDKASE